MKAFCYDVDHIIAKLKTFWRRSTTERHGYNMEMDWISVKNIKDVCEKYE